MNGGGAICIPWFRGVIFGKQTRLRWVGCIKMELKKTGWEEVGWSDLSQTTDKWWAVVNTEINLQVPQNARNFLPSFTRTLFH